MPRWSPNTIAAVRRLALLALAFAGRAEAQSTEAWQPPTLTITLRFTRAS